MFEEFRQVNCFMLVIRAGTGRKFLEGYLRPNYPQVAYITFIPINSRSHPRMTQLP